MFICARVYLGRGMGVGVRVQSGRARAQLGVCIHDLCGLYTEGGDRGRPCLQLKPKLSPYMLDAWYGMLMP